MIRKVEGVTRLDRVSNEDIRRRLGVEGVLPVADMKKKEWRNVTGEAGEESFRGGCVQKETERMAKKEVDR